MCLAVPGKIINITDNGLFRMALVDFAGVSRKICIDTVDAKPGDYIVAHAGVAISVMNEAEALATLADLEAMTEHREKIERAGV